MDLEVAAGLALPADLARRAVPARQATVDAARILGGAKPAPRAGLWTCELAPLTRIAAWQVPEPRVGDRLAVVDYIRPQSPELRMCGINLVSVTAVVALGLALLRTARAPTGQDQAQRVASATLIATLPALALLLLATQLGALGDRIWQFVFVALFATLPLARTSKAPTAAGQAPRIDEVALMLCLVIAVVNVIVRYPLSNYSAPLVPHVPITPSSSSRKR